MQIRLLYSFQGFDTNTGDTDAGAARGGPVGEWGCKQSSACRHIAIPTLASGDSRDTYAPPSSLPSLTQGMPFVALAVLFIRSNLLVARVYGKSFVRRAFALTERQTNLFAVCKWKGRKGDAKVLR